MKSQQRWVRDYDLKKTVYRVGEACVYLEMDGRGYYLGHAHGVPNLDAKQEGFPRHYMRRDRAEAELIHWLHVRMDVPLPDHD